jgi:hypothetical protein
VSYDVHVLRFRDGEVVPVESSGARELLLGAAVSPPDESEFCRVTRGDDEGDVYGLPPDGPIEGLMFNHAGSGIYELMYEVAEVGDMAIVPPDLGPFLVNEEQRTQLPPDLAAAAVVVESGSDLVRAIRGA